MIHFLQRIHPQTEITEIREIKQTRITGECSPDLI